MKSATKSDIEVRVQERASQCIWSNYITFSQKYYNSTNLSMWVVYATWVSKNSVVYQDAIFYLLWYNVIRWSSHISKNLLFSLSTVSLWSLVNNKGQVLGWNWQSVTKVNGVKNVIMKWHNFLNGPMFNLLFYIERKWLLTRKLVTILPLKSKLSRKFQRFNAIDRSIKMLKNSWIFKNIN